MNTDLVKVEAALTEFAAIETGLAELAARFKDVVYDVTTPEGMRQAKADRKEIRDPRVLTEDIRKGAKAPILALGRALDSKAKYIESRLLEIERPITEQIAAEESRLEREAFQEQQRVIGIKEAILDIERAPTSMTGKSAAEIDKRIAALTEFDLTEWAAEFIVPAEKAREQAIQVLQQLRAGAVAQEQAKAAEEAQRAVDAAELARLRAAQPAPEPHVPRGSSGVSAAGEIASGRALLKAFVDRYGHIKEFLPVADWHAKYTAKLEKKAA